MISPVQTAIRKGSPGWYQQTIVGSFVKSYIFSWKWMSEQVINHEWWERKRWANIPQVTVTLGSSNLLVNLWRRWRWLEQDSYRLDTNPSWCQTKAYDNNSIRTFQLYILWQIKYISHYTTIQIQFYVLIIHSVVLLSYKYTFQL